MTPPHDSTESVRDPLSESGGRTGGKALDLRWGLLTYFGLIALLITLAPFRFHSPSRLHFLWFGGWFDTICNVLLFLPLGFLYRLARQPLSEGRLAHVFRLALLVSACIEVTQLFMRGRYASPMDVLTNAFGALTGAWLCDRAQRFLNQRWVGRLALQLPLMNISYLLVPLIWLNGLAAGNDRPRARLSWLLGLCGSLVLAGVYRYGIAQTGAIPALVLTLVGLGWFFTSNLPALLVSPPILLSGCLLVVLTIGIQLAIPGLAQSDQRRFEIPVLKQVFPIYLAYLLLLFMWPVPTHYVAWRGSLEFLELGDEPGVTAILRLIEQFASFTLLGYMIAESTGRREISQARSVGWSCGWCGLGAGILEVGRGFHPLHIASFAQGLLTMTGGIYGATLYWLQLASIQRLLGRHAGVEPGSGSG
jgi:glycopeptide antibiotics resistance protein